MVERLPRAWGRCWEGAAGRPFPGTSRHQDPSGCLLTASRAQRLHSINALRLQSPKSPWEPIPSLRSARGPCVGHGCEPTLSHSSAGPAGRQAHCSDWEGLRPRQSVHLQRELGFLASLKRLRHRAICILIALLRESAIRGLATTPSLIILCLLPPLPLGQSLVTMNMSSEGGRTCFQEPQVRTMDH